MEKKWIKKKWCITKIEQTKKMQVKLGLTQTSDRLFLGEYPLTQLTGLEKKSF